MNRALLACVLWASALAPLEARAQEGPAVKVAVIVAGDPDDALRAAARELEDALAASPGLMLPSDPALRAALRGREAAEDDGLERVRIERRRLGLGGAGEARALAALGRMAGAAAVVVVRRTEAGIRALVMDVGRGAFFEDEMTLPEPSAGAFVTRRARAAARAAAGRAASDGARPDTEPAERTPPATGEPARTPAGGDDEGDEEDGGILSEWPLIVAGALLVGFLLFFTLDDEPAERGPPVLRFVPGGR